jgi:hypothetical protein
MRTIILRRKEVTLTESQAAFMDRVFSAAMKGAGVRQFERECGCDTFAGRKTKRYLIPGTSEAGRHSQLLNYANHLARAWRQGKDYGGGNDCARRPKFVCEAAADLLAFFAD